MEVVIKIEVKDNNIEQALRVLKRKLQRDGFFKIIKLKNTYEKPSEKKKRIQQENIKRVKKLSKKKVKLNITAVYTVKQVSRILNSIDKKSKTIISIFSGRMADVGKDPIPIIKESVRMTKRFKNVEILWASVREPYNFLQAKQLGCHIITVPPSIIQKIEKFGKSFDQLTNETVKGFLKDSKKSRFNI